MTEAEKRLWRELREFPNRFRRQHSIGNRIVDFACPAAKLAIELDGGQHAVGAKADEGAEPRNRTMRLSRHPLLERGCNGKPWGCFGNDKPRA
jgi:very-short-patch-repair endonuclease